MKSWLVSDIEALNTLVDEWCIKYNYCSECPFYSRTVDCLGDISNRLNRTLDLINKYKRELSQYV